MSLWKKRGPFRPWSFWWGLLDQILEKLFLANIKGSYMIFLPRLKTIFIPHSLKTTRNNPTSPHDGPIKKLFFTKTLYISITSNETVQNSKSKSKKFSFLCTFKKVSVDGSFGAEINISFQLYLQGLPHTCLHCPSASLGLVYPPPPFHTRSVLIKGTVREYRKTRNT